ncbi:unnamed protein product [Cylindrotheca closterium]|uniref:Uncharacterized protein n=1 Tax=Cylindrotheca closterium TaxID=2856 RepID=A0AAD2CN59_9STRA|nr:unnamed protein product [Cylindrotheca closterium]
MKTNSTCYFDPSRTQSRLLFLPRFVCSIFLLCYLLVNPSTAFQHQHPVIRSYPKTTRLNEIGTQSRPNIAEYSRTSKVRLPWRPRDYEPARAGVAAVLILAIIIGLSINDSNDVTQDEIAVTAVSNVVGATLPSSPTDLVAGALGESVGGFVGVFASASLSSLLNAFKSKNNTDISKDSRMTNAIAESDYFIVNSASLPLLMAIGLPPVLASVGSTLFAVIPSELIKLRQRRREMVIEEDRLLNDLLAKERNRRNSRPTMPKPFAKAKESIEEKVSVDNLLPVEAGGDVDAVEIFADVIRWLEYAVLKAEFGGTLTFNNMVLGPGISGAIFGIIASVSSQFYADVLYGELFELGPRSKQEEVSSRLTSDWVKVYASSAVSSAALFGVFEEAQIPVSRWIQGILAGGVDGCIGSTSFDICLQTYIDSNAPGPSPEAQLRALLVNFMMVGQRVQDIAGDTTWDDLRRLLAAWSVSAYSYFQHL